MYTNLVAETKNRLPLKELQENSVGTNIIKIGRKE